MLRRLWIAFYAFALVLLAVMTSAVALFCLLDVGLLHEVPWPFLLSGVVPAWLLWVTWRLLKRELTARRQRDDAAQVTAPSRQPESPSTIGLRSLLLTPLAGWLLLLIGLPTLIFALVFFTRTEIFLHRSISAEGTVARLVADRDETIHYAPVFTFTTRNGRSMTVESHTYSAPPEFSVGQKVRVLYEEDHPERARIVSHWQVHAAEEVCALIGLCFSGAGFGLLVYQRKWKPGLCGIGRQRCAVI
jgi:hypothetical protein